MLFAIAFLLFSTTALTAENQAASQKELNKVCAELDELYYALADTERGASEAVHADAGANAKENFDLADHFRRTIQFSETNDTVWVKVAITLQDGSEDGARATLISEGLRRVSQFGTLVTGQIPIQNLPQIDQLAEVERIEPVTPSAYTARTNVSTAVPRGNERSKKN